MSFGADLTLAKSCGKKNREEQLVALANREIIDFDPFESTIPVSFDPPDKKLIAARLSELVDQAVEHGFPLKKELFDVATRYGIWRLSIGNDPPSQIEPFEICFQDDTESIRCTPRTYAPAERDWMKTLMGGLLNGRC
ncbi:unnamed protein product [Phytophthora fragariaefolia]|uniref:Unnamed protein product n=1 Tax=Phytophthora fragariaefolia TaxID=1490495 RepID=A0A9W6XNV4_9STRA|nr:unnamed protein product [Phytophthora fragariaefolia]